MKTVIRNSYTPKLGDYCDTIVVDKETSSVYFFDCDGVWTEIDKIEAEEILAEAEAYTDAAVAPINEKLDTIEEGAQVNVIEEITQNGVPLHIIDKSVDVSVPTQTSDLINNGSDGTDTYVESAALSDYYTKSETDTQIGYETTAREIADSGLQEQIDAIVASSDVVDIVGTYAALQAYDTSKLHDNDIIKVLDDETRDDATTYYRWDADTSTWSYIGAEGPFYTKAESDAIFTPMTRTINSKALSSDITLTAADVGALPDSTVIPTVNDATLTIQKNGTTVQTFTANQATNATANITVPTDTSDLTNGAGFITSADLPTKTSDLTNDGSDGTSTYVEADDLATVATSGDYTDLVNTPTLATVATTGDYDDLINRPTIPTVNDATLTIQKNGVDVATFTANSSTNQTANITVPTDTGDLTNGAGFITTAALANYYTKSETYSQGEVNSLINGLNIPTKTSDLVNDSGFLTAVPIASAQDLGGIKVGSGLSIAADGTLSVTSAGAVAWNDITGKPSNVSYWTNDAGYITSADIPTNVSAFTNDAGYITSASIPTNVSAFTNDAGYLTSSALSNYYTKSETYSQQEVNALINAVPTYSDFTGATSGTAGAHGLVPAPAAGDEGKVLMGNGTWGEGAANTIFYMNSSETGATRHLYKASDMTGLVTMQDIIDANGKGQVIVRISTSVDPSSYSDMYLQNAYVASGDYQMIFLDNQYYYSFDTTQTSDSTFQFAKSEVQRKLTAGSNITINGNTISATDTTYSNFVGATSSVAGSAGLVPAPTTSDPDKFLKGDGTWAKPEAELVEMYYGESNAWAKFIAAYTGKKIVYCRASSNANPGSGAKTRKAFMAYVNNEDSPTSVEFQYVRSVSSKTDSQQCDQVFVYTLTNASGGTWSVTSRNMATKINVDSTLTKTYSSGANASMTLSANAMTGATSGAAGTAGIVPAPAAGDDTKFLKGDGTWASVSAGGGGVLIGYINYTSSTVPSGNISVYTDTTYTTAISADDVAAALDNGDTVFFRFTDGWDEIKILSIADSEAMIGDDTIVYHFMASSSKDCIGQLQGHVNDWNVAFFLSTLKTVGNGTLTIQHNGTDVQTFTANQSSNATANIETIWADDIEATTPVPSVETAMIADGAVTSAKIADGTIATGDIANSAVTSAKIDWSTVTSSYVSITKNTSYVGNIEASTVRSLGNGLVFVSIIFKLSANITAGSNVTVFSGLPGTPLGYYDIIGLDASAGKPVRFRLSGSSSANLNIAWDALAHGASSDITVSFVYPTK